MAVSLFRTTRPKGGEEQGAVAAMPRVWQGKRRRLLVILVLLGILQAGLAILMTLQVEALLNATENTDTWDLVSVVGFVLGIGVARWIERVVAEELGQDYVFEQRRRLIASAIAAPDYSGSIGVTVTRASNDLTAVRNWIALGIVPMVTGIPLIVLVVGALLFIDLRIGLAVAAPLVLVGAAVPVLARLTLARARELRRRRGRMSAKIADTVLAGESVRAAGAVRRELNSVDRNSRKVVSGAIDRAWITGLTRALTASAALMCTVAVVILSVGGFADPATVASTMMLLGVLSVPVSDLGRVVEYRQNYRAATRILAPLLGRAVELRKQEKKRERAWRRDFAGEEFSLGEVSIQGLIVEDRQLPDLHAQPGERIRLVAHDPHQVRATVSTLASLLVEDTVLINGLDLGKAPGKARRAGFGLASEHIPLERGSVARLVGFRAPEAEEGELLRVLDLLGLKTTIEANEKGLGFKLKNDGQPWSSSEVMRLKLARAMLREPNLLVLEGVDNVLGADGVQRLRALLVDYPGVVVFSSTHPTGLVEDYREWNVDGVEVEHQELISHGGPHAQVDDEDE